jgi:methionyl-tRNA formyltransferase
MMRVVLFGAGGPFSRVLLDALATRQAVVAVVSPQAAGRGLRKMAGGLLVRVVGRDFHGLVRRLGLPLVPYRRDAVEEAASALESLHPDLFCIGSFPYVLPKPILVLPRLGTVNVHPSLLPRHRGSDPVYWTYAGNDLEAGVTIHWVDEGVDTGNVIARRPVAVARGVTGGVLTERLAREAADLLVRTLPAIAEGTAPGTPQDGTNATREPAPSRAPWPVDFDTWPAERVWHFLRGVGTGRLFDASGRALTAGDAVSFETAAHDEPAGSARAGRSGVRLYCRDGWVDLARPSLRRLAARALIRVVRPRRRAGR